MEIIRGWFTPPEAQCADSSLRTKVYKSLDMNNSKEKCCRTDRLPLQWSERIETTERKIRTVGGWLKPPSRKHLSCGWNISPIYFSIFWAPEAAPIWKVICYRPWSEELCHVQIKVSRNMWRSPCVNGPLSFEGLRKFWNISPNSKAPHSTKHESLQSPVGSWACWKVLNVMCFSVPRGQQFPFFLNWKLRMSHI